MGFLLLLKFAVKCFDILAWPLFALGYPLCASIRAIESDSNKDIWKLVNYWVLLSLILVFDHTFGRLLESLPLWPYVKLIAIFWLVVPHFDGSCYAYENLVRPCLSVNPYVVIQWFNKWKVDFFLNRENFLVAAERYVNENGTEALERLIATKCSKPNIVVEEINAIAAMEKKEVDRCTKPDIDKKEIKAVAATEEEETQETKTVEVTDKRELAAELECKIPNVAQKEIRVVEVTKNQGTAVNWETKTVEETDKRELAAELECKNPNVAQKEIRTVEVTKNKGTAVNWVNQATPSLAQTENQTFAAAVTEEMVTTGGSESNLPEIPASKNVQKVWSCALCQVTTQSETVFNSHLQGKKHKAALEKLKANNQAAENKGSPVQTAKKSDQHIVETMKDASSNGSNQKNTGEQDEKETISGKQQNTNKISTVIKQAELWCEICNIKCPGEPQMDSHLKGKKHLARIREQADCSFLWL